MKRFIALALLFLAALPALGADDFNLRIIYGSGVAGEIFPCG